ncbi:MAG: YraN family protein [Phycisphaerae bacterium]
MWAWLGRLRSADSLGTRGEKLARRHLKRRGMKILASNYRARGGEVDIIALDPTTRAETSAETIVFVEVKTRTSDRYTDPASAVDNDKRRRLRKAAGQYLASRPTDGYATRYDIVSIVIPPGQNPRINHMPGAFR